MAFKKTSDGRIFFQGQAGATAPSQDMRKPSSMAQNAQSPQQPTQVQILSLLRSLNEKLKATQLERNVMRSEMEDYRRSMEALQTRAQRGERAEKLAQETMRELEETRKLLLDIEERQSGIEKDNKINFEKIHTGLGGFRTLAKRVEINEQKQEEIGRRVEDTVSQQAKLMRQIEKAIEDRSRFMRKIERIEETVIQTRDALTAKAMVLLTDNGNVQGHIPVDIEAAMREVAEQIEPGMPTRLEEPDTARESMRSAPLQAAAILLLVAGGILAGWAVSEMQQPQGQQPGEFQISEYSAPEETQTPATAPSITEKSDAIIEKWSVSEDTSAFSDSDAQAVAEAEPQETAPAADPSDDIGTLDLNDEARLQQMLDENPDALAAELNKIEPSLAPAEAPPQTQPAQIASLPMEETPAIDHDEPTADAPVVYKKSDIDVRTLIKPDSSLPAVVKTIETQAFEGVPEAQHDLAAIYTAGHGGVKQDYKRALFWFEQSANAGVANAAYNLGVLYHQGLGTKADIKKAIQWYTKAADLGHPEAQYNLGIAYIEGVGVTYDPVKAHDYFEKAANKGIMEAAYNLGLIYENGLLGKPQPDEALVWYKNAADKGSPEAKAALEQLAKTLDIKSEDIDRVVDSARKGRAVAPPPPQSEIRSDIMQSGNENMLAQIQEHLMGMGLYPGPADGSDSPQSQDAIRTYQALNKLEVTGQPSNGLLEHMLAEQR